MDNRIEKFMKEAIAEAWKGFEKEEVPVGAVAVLNGEIIARAHNLKETLNDPTAHAEILVLREASRVLNSWRLNEVEIFVTMEPCLMCAGAMVNARIKACYFGCFDEKSGAISSLYSINRDERLNHNFSAYGGFKSEEIVAMLQNFFKKLRKKGEES